MSGSITDVPEQPHTVLSIRHKLLFTGAQGNDAEPLRAVLSVRQTRHFAEGTRVAEMCAGLSGVLGGDLVPLHHFPDAELTSNTDDARCVC